MGIDGTESHGQNVHSAGNEEFKKIDPRQALQIITLAKDKSGFILEEENLNIIMAEIKKLERYAKELVVISVVGAFRTGKSFLLSTFIRYLQYCEANAREIPLEKHGEALWLKNKKKLMTGNVKSESTEPGFIWAAGKDRTTTGMWMYGVPFLRTIPGTNDKAIVLLMDTQGMFDMKTSKAVTAAIFGLSTLISSYQILNLKHQIQENALQELHFFSQYSLAALRELHKETKEETKEETQDGENEGDEKEAPFQMLEFLIRDYQHFEDDDDIEQSLAEMEPYLEGAFEERDHDDGMREQIMDTFQNIKCFLLPFPGTKMTAKKWDGDLEVVQDNFLSLIDHYVRRIFEQNLVVKKIQGQTLNAERFEQFIKAFIAIFKDGKMPQAKGLVQAIGDATNMCAKDEAAKVYTDEMNKLTGSFLVDAKLNEANEASKKEAFKVYDKTAVFGDVTKIKTIREGLETNLVKMFKDFRDKNKRRMHSNMAKYVVPFLLAIVAYLLDWISDYTCDRWLSYCRQFSKLASLVYFLVFLVVFIEFGRVYRNCGMATTGIVATSFGTALIDRAKTINDTRIQPFLQKFENNKEKKD